jgi:hypothetical protein
MNILEEYILQNTPQQSRDVSIIEIIADEVNETLNNLPEVQLASEILSEDELKDLFSPLARQVVTKIRSQIGQKIKGMVAEEITIDEFLGLLVAASGADSTEQAIANLTPAQTKAIREIIAREDENNPALGVIDRVQSARLAQQTGDEKFDADIDDEESPPDQMPDFEVGEDA